jgi:hypothetical protein
MESHRTEPSAGRGKRFSTRRRISIGVLGELAVADAWRSEPSSSTPATPAPTTPSPSAEDEQQIELIGNQWNGIAAPSVRPPSAAHLADGDEVAGLLRELDGANDSTTHEQRAISAGRFSTAVFQTRRACS